ncbi:hypothetical protein [Cupriavidus necator]
MPLAPGLVVDHDDLARLYADRRSQGARHRVQLWIYSDFCFDDEPVYGNDRIAGVPIGAYVDYANTEGAVLCAVRH